MLELGRAGNDGVLPVQRDGATVATLRPGDEDVTATAEVGGRSWAYTRQGAELTGRWTTDPEGAARLQARRTSMWKGTWSVLLEGTPVDVATASMWRSTRRYTSGGRVLAESGSTGGWSPRPTLDADPSVPLEHLVFLLWVELVAWRGAGGGDGAAITGSDGGADGGADGGGGGGGD